MIGVQQLSSYPSGDGRQVCRVLSTLKRTAALSLPLPSPSLHLLCQRRCTVPAPEDNRLLPVEGVSSATPLPIHAPYRTYRAKLTRILDGNPAMLDTRTYTLSFSRLAVPYPRPPMQPRPRNTRRARAPRGTDSTVMGEPVLDHRLALVNPHTLAYPSGSVLAAGTEILDVVAHFFRKLGRPGVGGVCLAAAARAPSRTKVVFLMTNSVLSTSSV